MLRDARARRRAGADTVVAQWERHGRPGTAAQLDDLEVLPARTVTYRDASFAELDVRAVLGRRPQLAVVDSSPTRTSPASATPNAGRTSTTCWQAASTSIPPSTSPTSNRWARPSPGSPAYARPSRCRTRSCGPARSSSSTLPLRRCGAGWPRASSSPGTRWIRHCRTISASRTSPPCGSSRSCGSMTPFPIPSWRTPPPTASGNRFRPRSSWSGWRGRRRRVAHPLRRPPRRAVRRQAPGGVRPGDRQPRPAPAERLEKDRGCWRTGRQPCLKSGPATRFRADPGRTPSRRLPARDRVAPPVALARLLNGSAVADQVLRAAGDLPVQVVNVGRPG